MVCVSSACAVGYGEAGVSEGAELRPCFLEKKVYNIRRCVPMAQLDRAIAF